MGSVIYQEMPDVRVMHLRKRKQTMRRLKIATFIFYMLAIPAYLIVGLQPSSASMAETLASESENASSFLIINSINLSTPVADVELRDNTLVAPDHIVGSFSSHPGKTLLIGHSSTIFQDLNRVRFGDIIDYNDHSYRVTNIEIRTKDKISMTNVLAGSEHETLVLMTCSGEKISTNDYTDRLIITAEAVD